MSFSELWQKARFEEARLRDLENSVYASPISRKFPGPTDERHREDRMTPPFRPNQIPNRESTRQFRPGERNQTILCYKCHQPGHVARNCRQGTRFSEAPGRQNVPRTAAVTPNQETIQQREQQSSDTPDESLAWMYGVRHIGQDVTGSTCQSLRLGPTPKLTMIVNGIEVEALVDTGCPATIISKTLCRQILDSGVEQDDPSIHEHRRQRATVLQLNKPSLQLHAYCGTQLSIGAEITVDFKVGECQAKGVVLVQENTPVDVLLGTNLMSLLGVQVLDNNRQSLLALQSYEAQEKPVTTEKGLPLNDTVEQQSDYTQQSPHAETPLLPAESLDNTAKHTAKSKHLAPFRIVDGGRRKVLGPANPAPQQKAVVRLVRACKLPARSGKLLQAKVNQTQLPLLPQLFEPDSRLHSSTVDIPNALLPCNKRQLFLPVYNFPEAPTWLKRGQILGWMRHADVVETDQTNQTVRELQSLSSTPESEIQSSTFLSSPDHSSPEIGLTATAKVNTEPEATLTNNEEQAKNKLTPAPIKAIVVEDNSHHEQDNWDRAQKITAELQLDQATLLPEQQSALEALLLDHADIFALDNSELGSTDIVQHQIDTGDSLPIYQHARRIPFSLRSLVDEMVQDMLDQDIIQPSHSPWASPVVLVKKYDGSMRFCVDYRCLNSVTKRDVHPLSRIDDTLDVLAGARYFTTLDLASGYWQVAVHPADREKTAFITHSGLFEFSVMPFGLCNAPATFQRLMETVLLGLTRKQCFVYLDDILVISSTWEEHLQNLELVFERL